MKSNNLFLKKNLQQIKFSAKVDLNFAKKLKLKKGKQNIQK